jgi:hypothetical protein
MARLDAFARAWLDAFVMARLDAFARAWLGAFAIAWLDIVQVVMVAL